MGDAPRADLAFNTAPSALCFMLRAFAPSPGLSSAPSPFAATWRDLRITPQQLGAFASLSGLPVDESLPILLPQVVGFRLSMALLTHPRFPLPIWRALQVRNCIEQHAPLPQDGRYDLRTETSAQRVLERGVEIDLLTTVHAGDALVWQATNTFYYRGSYGPAQAADPDAATPQVAGETLARWRTRGDVGWAMARLTGDYNGIHLWNPYARMLGFTGAFHHPQLIAGQCLARLQAVRGWPQELRLWLKGPVLYGVDVRLDAVSNASEAVFALYAEDKRPALVGRWRA